MAVSTLPTLPYFDATVNIIFKHTYRILGLLLILCVGAQAEIIYESGSLREFIGGTSETTAYDNYVSHVSEGIVTPGYNDYGPDWIDVQTNGFE